MVHTILTHPGGAHKDEILAASVLIALHRAPIVRRDPSPAELDDPEVAILDVGGIHDPARMNFDHHHFPREHPPTCALSLVLDHLGIYEDALHFCDWLEPAEWFDSRGPTKTARHLGVPRKAISQLHSPIDITLLRRFAKATVLAPGDTLYDYLRFVGQDLLDYLRLARARLDEVAARVERWTVRAGSDSFEAVFLPRDEAAPADEPSIALASYIRAEGLDDQIAALVYPDRRGPGYGMRRHEDHPGLDFARVEREPDVGFAHKSGFMCKTRATEPARLQAILAAAWRG